MPDGEITIGELSRTIAAMDARMGAQFAAINGRLDGLQFVHRETYAVQMGAVNDRLDTIEERLRWTGRTFIAAFVFPVLVAIIATLVAIR